MGRYVNNGDAWLGHAYGFLAHPDQAALRTVAKYGGNVDREAIRQGAQNIYAMLTDAPRKSCEKLEKEMRRIMCGIPRTSQ